jgi:ABC-type transport system involved in multi-copper enzyme maturation permease subunit
VSTANPTTLIASWEYRTAVRTRWVLTMAAVFGGLCVIVTLLAFRTVRELGLTGIGPASATLVNLGVLLPSLMGLLLGAGSLAGQREHGLLALVCAQPLRRSQVATGAILGLSASLLTTLGVGFGLALLILAGVARGTDLPALLALAGTTAAVGAASVAIGVAISTMVASRVQGISIAVGLWIVMSLGVDLALAALAPSVHLGPLGLLIVVALNPLETGRILALLATNLKGTALGPFGAYLVSTFGTAGAVGLLVADLVAWIALPTLLARRALTRADL